MMPRVAARAAQRDIAATRRHHARPSHRPGARRWLPLRAAAERLLKRYAMMLLAARLLKRFCRVYFRLMLAPYAAMLMPR